MNDKHQKERHVPVTWCKCEMPFLKSVGDNLLLSLPSLFFDNKNLQ